MPVNPIACAILLGGLLSGSARTEPLRGSIRDESGAAIQGATIIVHWDSTGSDRGIGNVGTTSDVIIRTNKEGEFSADLPPGLYDLFASAPAFSPSCRKVRVPKGSDMTRYDERLAVSSLALVGLAENIVVPAKPLKTIPK